MTFLTRSEVVEINELIAKARDEIEMSTLDRKALFMRLNTLSRVLEMQSKRINELEKSLSALVIYLKVEPFKKMIVDESEIPPPAKMVEIIEYKKGNK